MHSEEMCSHYFTVAKTPSQSGVKPMSWLVFTPCGSRPQQYCNQVLPGSIQMLTHKTLLDLSLLHESTGSKREKKKVSESQGHWERPPLNFVCATKKEWLSDSSDWVGGFSNCSIVEMNIWCVSQELNSSSIFTDVYEMCSGFHYYCIWQHDRWFFHD